ncbi:MAG TPA: selenocysteine-specific translation elongation factor [Candidatus Acidoferrales bacterium]|nr:selenocysteine-specific translation elongation factor [Candidatus Acidoferrales bacterium]
MTTRRNIMLGTAGHVDHGKSALVKLLTGCETDTLAEEKQRGLTIDLGFAPCQLADRRVVGVVDVPGHVDFIRNMVAGAHGIDVVIFVVAADDGIMPQTEEHLHILTLMGLRHGLVALTKIDLADAARREFVVRDLRRLLAPTFLAGAPICPLSNVTGEGFDGFFDALNETVEACGERACDGPFRLWVEDAFTIRGAGTVVTGIPTHGRVRCGDELHLLPAGLSGHVRRLQVYGEDAKEGRAGECVALNIPELDHEALKRGLTLVESNLIEAVAMAEAELHILDSVPKAIEDYLEVQLHVGTAAVSAHLAMLEKTELAPGQKQFVQLRLASALPLLPGERFVVRANVAGSGGAGSITIGGGRILGLSNTRLRRQKQWTLELLAARRDALGGPARWCEQMVRESDTPASVTSLQKKCWSRAEEIAAMLGRLRAEGVTVQVNGGWIHKDVIQKNGEAVLAAIEKFHATDAPRAGISREELASALKLNPAVLAAVIESLLRSGQLAAAGALLARPGWSSQLPDRDQKMCRQLAARLQQEGCAPSSPEELAAALAESPARIAALLQLLAERGEVLRLDDKIWMHRDAVEAGKQAALMLFHRAPSFSTMDFRDALGVSRKFAVPLVDHLDKIRFTVRCGHNRTPGLEAKKLLSQNQG